MIATLLEALLAYLINLASNERSTAIAARRQRELDDSLEKEQLLEEAVRSKRSLRDELRAACMELVRNRAQFGVSSQEEPLWLLLNDDVFQSDLAAWLMAGGIEEGAAIKDRLVHTMALALTNAGALPTQITYLKTEYFDALEKAVFAHPILARWRHHMSLAYLREQVSVLRQRAEEAAGIYSAEKQKATLGRYFEKALAAWDIIDLSNLPEGDIHMATQKLLLRQLYMPLRIAIERANPEGGDDAILARMELEREARRHREAGHSLRDAPDQSHQVSRLSVGQCLSASRRLVVLGDPGGGKTTMLRWMATAFLLRLTGDSSFAQIPDTETLSVDNFIPVLIRCRDIGADDLCRCFADFLRQHLHKTELRPEDADVMLAIILDRIATGTALLLVDGLDEISDPRVRMMFCQELERTAVRYPDAPIVVTSRIVGYRDMPYRMGSGFEHGVIAELSEDDKDLFAERWVEVTEQNQTATERVKRAHELRQALHSSDRVERLTGNPMLLTTLALVKRKVGKLPNRRTKLYTEAVFVLLNWNPRHYDAIDEDEAMPQLEYLAYEMCRRGVQRMTNNEVLDLLDRLRTEYPNVRAIRSREPQEFLQLLEARSSIIIRSGGIWQKHSPREDPVWEFRHLTFQEFLAARALLDGRYPGRDKTITLAQQVAVLAGSLESNDIQRRASAESEVRESWREALRLLVADCKDDDVDGIMLAILNPAADEDATETARPRAVLAALCLVDEPNVSEEVACRVLAHFASKIGESDGQGEPETAVDRAAIDVGGSIWASRLKAALIEEFIQRPSKLRVNVGGLYPMVEMANWSRSGLRIEKSMLQLVERLHSSDRVEVVSAALAVMEAAYERKACMVPGLVEALFALLGKGRPETHAATWALVWLVASRTELGQKDDGPIWKPGPSEVQLLIEFLSGVSNDESDTARFLCIVLGDSANALAVDPLVHRLDDPDAGVRRAAVEALGKLRDPQAVEPLVRRLDDADNRNFVIRALKVLGDTAAEALVRRLDDPDVGRRLSAIEALGELGNLESIEPLVRRLDDHSPEVCFAAAIALSNLGDSRGSPVLGGYLADSSGQRRRQAVRGLAHDLGNLEKALLSRDVDGMYPWLDPAQSITQSRVTECAIQLDLSEDDVRQRYQALAGTFQLSLDW